MGISKNLKTKGVYLGKLYIDGDRFEFEKALERKDYIALGDVVYGCYDSNKLLKIGMSAAINGFYDRQSAYKAKGDKTSIMMIRKMKEMGIESLDVYGVGIPREVSISFDAILGETVVARISKAKEYETEYMARAIEEGHELPLCTSKK